MSKRMNQKYLKCSTQRRSKSLQNVVDLRKRFHEMVVVGVAVRTDEASAVLAVRLRLHPVPPDHFELALVTRRPRRTARRSGKHVVRVHWPDDEYRAVPSRLAGSTLQRAYDAVRAEHADCGEKARPGLVRHRDCQFACERRQVKGSIQKWIFVVDGHRRPA